MSEGLGSRLADVGTFIYFMFVFALERVSSQRLHNSDKGNPVIFTDQFGQAACLLKKITMSNSYSE